MPNQHRSNSVVVAVAVAVLCGASAANAQLSERRAVWLKEVKQRGATIEMRGRAPVKIDLPDATDADLELIQGMLELRELNINGDVSAKWLDNLTRAPKLRKLIVNCKHEPPRDILLPLARIETLRHLSFSGTVGDSELAHLAKLEKLHSLFISSRNIHGSGLSHLQKLPNLRELELNLTELDERWISNIAELELTRLKFSSVKVTDSDLDQLHRMTSLRELILNDSFDPFYSPAYTDQGLTYLQEALPLCRVVH